MAFPMLNMLSFWIVRRLAGCWSSRRSSCRSARPAPAGRPTRRSRPTSARPGWGRRWWCLAIFVTGVVDASWAAINYITTVIRLRAPGMTLHAHAAHGLGPLAHGDPERAVRAGARLGRRSCSLLDRVVRHAVLHRRRGGRAAAIRSSSSTCSGSSATRRSTSSSCRPGASSATSSRSSRASRPTGTRARSAR